MSGGGSRSAGVGGGVGWIALFAADAAVFLRFLGLLGAGGICVSAGGLKSGGHIPGPPRYISGLAIPRLFMIFLLIRQSSLILLR